jgi:hypothetical protein
MIMTIQHIHENKEINIIHIPTVFDEPFGVKKEENKVEITNKVVGTAALI